MQDIYVIGNAATQIVIFSFSISHFLGLIRFRLSGNPGRAAHICLTALFFVPILLNEVSGNRRVDETSIRPFRVKSFGFREYSKNLAYTKILYFGRTI